MQHLVDYGVVGVFRLQVKSREAAGATAGQVGDGNLPVARCPAPSAHVRLTQAVIVDGIDAVGPVEPSETQLGLYEPPGRRILAKYLEPVFIQLDEADVRLALERIKTKRPSPCLTVEP